MTSVFTVRIRRRVTLSIAWILTIMIAAALASAAQQQSQGQQSSQPQQQSQGQEASQPQQQSQGQQLTQPQPAVQPNSQAGAAQSASKGCIAVEDVGSHAFRNIMLLGAAGAFMSKHQYKVVDVSGYPAQVGQKFHGDDLHMIQGGGTRVVLLPKKYTQDMLRSACQ